MTPAWNESAWGVVLRRMIVAAVLLALLVLSALPLNIARLGEIRPSFMLMAVYYGTILRPQTLPPVAVFIIGVVLDFLSAWPPGMQALVMVAVQWLTRSQRKFLLGQPFPVIWVGFAMIALGSGIVQWGLFSLLNFTFVPLKAMLAGVVFSTFVFPLAAMPLHMVYKALTDPPSS